MSAETGFFTVEERNAHWWFIAPDGHPFFSIGMNHVDSASLRYPESLHIWRERYGNDQRRWLQERVAPDLRDWGFNTVGWTQEVVVRGPTLHRHSRRFTFEEYQWLGLPYCHLLPFAEIHQWDVETPYPDVFSAEFEDWCDHVARADCARMADDPKLIGYFYTDCPTWIHPCVRPERKGPWFHPERLTADEGRQELSELASRYYQMTHDAVRRYDANHLILGDRYEAARPLAEEVLKAAVPYVDVLSFQFFSDADSIRRTFAHWHEVTGLPVLLADACATGRDMGHYPEMMQALVELLCCVGWHYCGAYVRNRCRGWGFRDETDEVDEELAAVVQEANREAAAWVARTVRGHPGDGS